MASEVDSSNIVIIGGGLAGLTTAALLARSGKAVTLFEQSSNEIGGRSVIAPLHLGDIHLHSVKERFT